jgi:ribose 1,5-bisphosphokinase PhnN
VAETEDRWVARLRPAPGTAVDALLALPLGLDVWERHGDVVVVAASEMQLSELERRGLAQVERLSTVTEFEARARRRSTREGGRPG